MEFKIKESEIDLIFLSASIMVMFLFLFIGITYYVEGHYKLSLFMIELSLFSFFPYGLWNYLKLRHEWIYNQNLILFLNDLANYVNTGMPLREAILQTAKNKYGVFSSVIKDLEARLHMGFSVADSIEAAFSRINYKNNKIVKTLLVIADKVGGDIGASVSQLAMAFTSYINAKKSQMAAVSSYMIIASIGYGVYLFTIALVFDTLFPQFVKLSGGITAFGSGFSLSLIYIQQFEYYVFLSVVILGFVTGFVSSTLKENSFKSGFFYSGIYILVAIITQALVWGL
ncbi:MAG: type II secretion system F family protein [Thermoplasmata archaeon]|jgi:type II secretory pathway component PulF